MLGYILLSKPQTVISIDPVTVGCVFYSANVHKYFLRVKRITFTVQYLQNFVNLDPTTNQKINKLTGKQLIFTEDMKAMNEEILNHRETIVDLYSVFIRTSTAKKDWPRKDHKFSVFSDLSEVELEIEDCSKIVDFTRCSYTVRDSEKIFFLVNNSETSKLQLLEYSIQEELIQSPNQQNVYFKPFRIDRGKELELDF